MAYSKEEIDKIFNSITEKIKDGKALRTILKEKGMPSSKTFYVWIEKDQDLMKRYRESLKNIVYIDAVRCSANEKGSRAEDISDYRRLNARAINKKKFPDSFIYIIKIKGTNCCKIGVSKNPDRRHRDINSSMPFDLQTLIIKEVKNAYDLEENLHNIFIKSYMKSEWFFLDLKEVLRAIEIINKWEK